MSLFVVVVAYDDGICIFQEESVMSTCGILVVLGWAIGVEISIECDDDTKTQNNKTNEEFRYAVLNRRALMRKLHSN